MSHRLYKPLTALKSLCTEFERPSDIYLPSMYAMAAVPHGFRQCFTSWLPYKVMNYLTKILASLPTLEVVDFHQQRYWDDVSLFKNLLGSKGKAGHDENKGFDVVMFKMVGPRK